MRADSLEKVIVILSAMAPHIASELLEVLFNKKLQDCSWPAYQAALTRTYEVTLALQVNGKMRGTLVMPAGVKQQMVESAAALELTKWLEGKTIDKVIYVQDKLINFVTTERN
jgi:leucyl-tRNA synthetase